MEYRVSVIMPALNEENNIEGAIKDVIMAFRRLNIVGEIIVINDGSTDGTAEKIRVINESEPNIRMLAHERPHGIGASFWEGAQAAKGKIVTMIPGDGENYSYEILRYVPLMDQVDIVVPFIINKNKRTLKRKIISKTYKAIINLSFGMLLNYMNGTVMYNRRVLETVALKSKGFFYQTELLIKCLKLGYAYAEVPSLLFSRDEGKSKALSLPSLFNIIKSNFATLIAVTFFIPKNTTPVPGTATASRHLEFSEKASLEGELPPKSETAAS